MIRALCLMLFAAPAAAADLTVALDWTPNTNHIGLYVAEARGIYDAAGLDVTILPYTDTSSAVLVDSGVAEFGVLTSGGFFTRAAAGADLKAAYAVVQHETGRLVFNADSGIETPADLDGRTYGGFGSDYENALIGTIIRNGGGKGDYTNVTLGTSAYEALASGRVDFTLEVYTWEGVNAQLLGLEQKAFRYADYGVPDQHTTLIGGRGSWMADHPADAQAFLRATAEGYAWAAANPDAAADILIDATAGMLSNPDQIRGSMKALADGAYLVDAAGQAGQIDPAKIEAAGDFFFDNGILKDAEGAVLTERPDFKSWLMSDW
ncbi:ABC transporter substrate-binding protein [Falsirhodobacter xinxiangensis]|uniref:ABC transporter substrate-binding protein n=1 Tax=Falsirhodobacter xinxiangensis TaxID=2530049 RepID=UPI0010AA73DF|nr:ABC transporter substrate-binding protein [Rhodobacter xinxiangensis]